MKIPLGVIKRVELSEIVCLSKPAETLVWIVCAAICVITNDANEDFYKQNEENPARLWNYSKKILSKDTFLVNLVEYNDHKASEDVLNYARGILAHERFVGYESSEKSLTESKLLDFLKEAISERVTGEEAKEEL